MGGGTAEEKRSLENTLAGEILIKGYTELIIPALDECWNVF